jgi:murein peptide amidase A
MTVAAAATSVFGHSVEGRPLEVTRSGDGRRRVLVVGAIHGDEPQTPRVVRAARARGGVTVYAVPVLNPDGLARGTRTNARGVDLNRNFPQRWRTGARGRFFPGPRAASEPETRALMRLVRRIDPHVTVHYHQPYGFVNRSEGADPALLRAYARRTGMTVRALPRYRGTASGWQNRRAGGEAFVVELGPGGAAAHRHARAAVALAAAPAHAAAAEKPRIDWDPIPYGRDRVRQMRRYARRHYGVDSAKLNPVRQIVQHVTAGGTYRSTWNTFAANAPDVEYGERPGVCAHFVVDVDGSIHQLVRRDRMCRHVVGLNHVTLGIEHVARTDAEFWARPRQVRASLALTRWLMERHAIARRDVIGHNESLSSRFYRERVERFRGRTHGDMTPRSMRRYRRRL